MTIRSSLFVRTRGNAESDVRKAWRAAVAAALVCWLSACADATEEMIIPTFQETPDNLREASRPAPGIFATPDRESEPLTPAEIQEAISELENAREALPPAPGRPAPEAEASQAPSSSGPVDLSP